MVSLENRTDYSLRISESPKLTAFNSLLLNKTITVPNEQDLNESDAIYFGLINAIQMSDRAAFENFYNKKNKSNPSKESPSPFVNDDFLIFCLIIGITKFDLDKSWIKNIISIRSRSASTITFENLLNGNYYSKSNLFEVVLMFFQLNNSTLITADFLNDAFKSITTNNTLFESKSDFQILSALRAYDSIILLKESPDGSEISLLKQFNKTFLTRVKVFAWFIQTAILVIILYAFMKMISINPDMKVLFDKIGSVLKILALVGLSQLGNLLPVLKSKSYEILLRLVGYPKELISRLDKSEKK